MVVIASLAMKVMKKHFQPQKLTISELKLGNLR